MRLTNTAAPVVLALSLAGGATAGGGQDWSAYRVLVQYVDSLCGSWAHGEAALRPSECRSIKKHAQHVHDAESRRHFVGDAVSLGARRKVPGYVAFAGLPYVPNEAVFGFLVECLFDEALQVQEKACRLLASKGTDELIARYAERIRQGLDRYRTAYYQKHDTYYGSGKEIIARGFRDTVTVLEGDNLLCRMPLDKEEKRILLTRFRHSAGDRNLWCRARLGDASAEDTLVSRFKDTGNSSEKGRAADWLARAGTPAAMKALFSELYSPMLMSNDTVPSTCKVPPNEFGVSIRWDIALAIGRQHPDLAMIDSIACVRTVNWEAKQGGHEVAMGLLTRLVEMGRKLYGAKVTGKEPGARDVVFFVLPPGGCFSIQQ